MDTSNDLPLRVVLDDCNYELLTLEEVKDIENTKNFILKKSIKVKEVDLYIQMEISGKVNSSEFEIPKETISHKYIVILNGKKIVESIGICCEPKQDRDQCEFYKEKCINKMNQFNYVLKNKNTNSLLVDDRPSGNKGIHIRVSQVDLTGIKGLFNNSIYGSDGCK